MTRKVSLEHRHDQPDRDQRLYLPNAEGWEARIKLGWEKEYCYAKRPGEDFFHLLISGEIYLQRGNEKFCLDCAYRQGILTADRLYWQHLPRKGEPMPF